MTPILNIFDSEGVRFAHEVHPSEIAYDYWTSVPTLEAIDHREGFGFNWDPSHKDTRMRPHNGRARVLSRPTSRSCSNSGAGVANDRARAGGYKLATNTGYNGFWDTLIAPQTP